MGTALKTKTKTNTHGKKAGYVETEPTCHPRGRGIHRSSPPQLPLREHDGHVQEKRRLGPGKWKGRHATCWEHDGAFYSACNGVLKATYTLELVYVAGGAERAQLRSKSWGRGKKPSKVPAVKRPFPNNAGKHPDYGGGTAPQDQERGVRSGARCEVWGSFQS